jgi:hypothetical protein
MKKEREKSDPSSEEAGEQTESLRGRPLGLRGGVGGAKGRGRGKHGRATHVPDTEPGNGMLSPPHKFWLRKAL